MSLDAGTRLGPYEILAPIGAGGMGGEDKESVHLTFLLNFFDELRRRAPASK